MGTGCVDGVTAAITPKGAISTTVKHIVARPRRGLQIFNARRVLYNNLQFANFVRHLAHAGFFNGFLRDPL